MTNTATATQSSCTGSVSAEPKTAVIASPVNVTMNPMQKLLMMVPSPMYRRPQSSCGTKRQRFISTFSMLNGRPTSSANRRFSALMESLPRRENLNTAMPMPMMATPAIMPRMRRRVIFWPRRFMCKTPFHF